MNKKILLPLLILGLGLAACGPTGTPSESTSTPDGGTTESETESVETPIWEEDLVDGETAIADIANGEDGTYYMVRGTVIGRSGSTFALARGGHALYCYNFNSSKNENIEAFAAGNYVEVYAQISHYENSVQMTAYVSGANDLNAYVQVLADEGEPLTPTAVTADNFATTYCNTNAGAYLSIAGLVNTGGAFTADNTSSNEDATFTLGESTVTVRLEKFFDSATRAAFVATLDALEATATYTITGVMTASSGGGRLLLVDTSTVTKTAEATEVPPVVETNYGTAENPLAIDEFIAEATELNIASGTTHAEYFYVEGVVSANDAWNSSYSNYGDKIYFYNGTTANAIFAFRMKVATGLDLSAYTEADSLVGATLVLQAKAQVYNDVLQLSSGSIIAMTPAAGGDTGGDEPAGQKVITLTVDSLGLASNSYSAGTATVDGASFEWIQLGNYGDGLQVRDKNGNTSSLWNTVAFESGITKIELEYSATKDVQYANANAEIFSFGDAVDNLTYSTKLSTEAGVKSYTITPDASTYTFFHFEHDLGFTFYWASITIYLA